MYKRILVPIDGSVTSNMGLDEAAKLAKLCGASLRLIHIVDPTAFTTGYEALGPQTGQEIAAIVAAAQELLDVGKGRAVANGALNADTVLVEYSAARVSERIVDQAKSWGADLIVMGTHGRRGVGRVLLGSDAEQTARIAPVPVLLVRVLDDAAST
jgi:nucleotide-binding universal stress UspA family protein